MPEPIGDCTPEELVLSQKNTAPKSPFCNLVFADVPLGINDHTNVTIFSIKCRVVKFPDQTGKLILSIQIFSPAGCIPDKAVHWVQHSLFFL